METTRTFVALPLSEDLETQIRKVQRELARLVPNCVRWVKPEQAHLTLAFLGNVLVDQHQQLLFRVERTAQAFAPPRLALGGVGCFPDVRRPRVVWVGLEGEIVKLRQIQQEVSNATQGFGEHQEERDFHPHLTIGRINRVRGGATDSFGEALRLLADSPAIEWIPQRIHVIASQLSPSGPVYRDLGVVPFLGHSAEAKG